MTPDLQALLGRLPLEEFFDEYWEVRPLVLPLGDAASVAPLLEVRDVEFLTATLGNLDAKWIRLVNNRNRGPLPEFQRHGEGLSMERILEAYREGTTVVLNDLQERWPPIRDLAGRLWRDFNDTMALPLRAVGVNAYLSPPNAEALPAHSDGHCVCVLQLSGEKTWTLYGREEAPAPADRESREVTLRAGDFVYIPRAWPHKARTAGSHSLHLAVGLYPYTWGDVLARAVQALPECRRSLPRGALSGGGPPPAVRQTLSEIVVSLRDRATEAAALSPVREEIERRRDRLECHGFERCHAIEAIESGTPVIRRPGTRLSLRRQGDKVVLDLGGSGLLQAPAAAEPALRYVMENERFTASSLPGVLNDGSRRVLVRRLLKDGVLELASASASPEERAAGGLGR